MKALSLIPGTKQVRIADRPEPSIESPTQVKVKVLQVGICGTDREEVAGGRADAPQGEKELIIGHEMVGEVVQVGAQVKTLQPHDCVVIMVRRPCALCEPCKKECPDMCASGQYTERGIKGRHGFDAEFAVDEERYMVKIPAAIRSIAVLTEPTTVVEKAIDHASRLQVARLPVDPNPKQWLQGKRVLVAGLGTIGLLACMILRLRGAHVIGMDIVEPQSLRPRLLTAIGGHYMKSSDQAMRGALKSQGSFDMIVEAAGISKLDFELIEPLGYNGVYVLTGVPGDDHLLNIDVGGMMRKLVLKNQILFGSVNAGHAHFKQAAFDLEDAERKWPHWVGQLITSRTPFADYASVLLHRKPDEIKAVIEWTV